MSKENKQQYTFKKEAGRKTLYLKKYNAKIIDHMKKGNSLASFAAEIKVSKQTVYNWINEHEDFKEFFEIAVTASQAFWEKIALKNALTAKGNGTQIQYQLSKRFRDEYGDLPQINIINNNQNINKDIHDMSREELEKYENELLQKLEQNEH